MKEISLNNDIKEIHITLSFDSLESAQEQLKNAKQNLESIGAKIITLEVSSASFADIAIDEFTKDAPYPINRILPLDQTSTPILAGAHIIAITGTEPKYATTQEGTASVMYSDGIFDYCRTFGVISKVSNDNLFEQTLDNLNQIEKSLQNFGFSYNDIVRTWFYNEDILSWYDDFNKARTQFYNQRNIFSCLLPASTGIGAPNKSGQKMISGAIALKKCNDLGDVYEIESPLQCGAPEYGSSFSRAIEIDTPSSRRIMVSGTASIEPMGATVFQDDIEKQVDLTMKVIIAILENRGLTLEDTVNSIVYCLNAQYYQTFQKWMQNNIKIENMPSYSIVCRDDLLFEVELEAGKNK